MCFFVFVVVVVVGFLFFVFVCLFFVLLLFCLFVFLVSDFFPPSRLFLCFVTQSFPLFMGGLGGGDDASVVFAFSVSRSVSSGQLCVCMVCRWRAYNFLSAENSGLSNIPVLN